MYGVLEDIAPREGVICGMRKKKVQEPRDRSLKCALFIERPDEELINSKNQKEVSHGS